MLTSDELTLAIIAGGAGRRLGGTVKALLELGGRTILSRILELQRRCSTVFVVGRPGEHWENVWLPVIADVVPNAGAPGGVVTALLEARTPWVLVVAADMPFVTLAALQALEAVASNEVDVVVASRHGEPEPLFGLYRASLGAAFRERLSQHPSLKELVRSTRLVEVPLDPAILDSVNTPDDLARARERLVAEPIVPESSR